MPFIFQLLFAPVFIPYFLSSMEILKGEGLQAIKAKLNDVGDFNIIIKHAYYLIIPAKGNGI